MKKLIMTIGLATLTTLGAFAQDLDQQIAVTRDAITHLGADLGNRDSSGGLRLSDYRPWEQKFKKVIEKNLEVFEKEMALKVYAPLKEIIRKMDVIGNDKNIPPQHREDLLNAYDSSVKSILPMVQKEYHAIVKKLYSSGSYFPSGVKIVNSVVTEYDREGKPRGRFGKKFYTKEMNTLQAIYHDGKTSQNSFEVESTAGKVKLRYSDDLGNTSYEFEMSQLDLSLRVLSYAYETVSPWMILLVNKAPYKVTHERLISGCQSKSCLFIKSSDLAFWYKSITTMLNKSINITVQGRSYSLHKLNGGYDWLGEAVLSRTDLPAELENLPFDI